MQVLEQPGCLHFRYYYVINRANYNFFFRSIFESLIVLDQHAPAPLAPSHIILRLTICLLD